MLTISVLLRASASPQSQMARPKRYRQSTVNFEGHWPKRTHSQNVATIDSATRGSENFEHFDSGGL